MDAGSNDSIHVDLDHLADFTAAQQHIVTTLAECAAELDGGGMCDWADHGPPRRAADATLDRLLDLAARLRGCGVAVDAVAADLGRAGAAFADAESAAASWATGRPA